MWWQPESVSYVSHFDVVSSPIKCLISALMLLSSIYFQKILSGKDDVMTM